MVKFKNKVRRHAQQFSEVEVPNIQRSIFNRSNTHWTSFNAGRIVPVYVDEVIAGDTFDISMSAVGRLTTPIFPTMDGIKIDFHAFFVPFRILWTGWEELCGENKTGAWIPAEKPALVPVYSEASDSDVPVADVVEERSLLDYLGVAPGTKLKGNIPFTVLKERGYYLIYNYWYRDENLQAPIPIDFGDIYKPSIPLGGVKSWKTGSLLKACKPHDYFTSCLPSPQKGNSPLVPIDIADYLPVVTASIDALQPGVSRYFRPLRWLTTDGAADDPKVGELPLSSSQNYALDISGSAVNGTKGLSYAGTTQDTTLDLPLVPANLFAQTNGGSISSATISELRTLFQIQKLYEKDARGGTRYAEMLKAHFGVEVQDYRVQYPEYLGKCSTGMNIYQVPQTSGTTETSPQGNMSGFGYLNLDGKKIFKKSFTEPGYVYVLAVARQYKSYPQGLEKSWTRRDRFDFYYPTLAHISEQPVYNREIYSIGGDAKLNEVFGYQEPWADYRYKPSQVTGGMRVGVTGSFAPYHYADHYSSMPKLSAEWIEDNSAENIDRTLAVPSETSDQFIFNIGFQNRATREMPVYGIPGLVDHF